MVNSSFQAILAKSGKVVRLVDKEPTILRFRDGTIKKVKGNSYGFIKPDGAPDNSTNIYFANLKEGETPFEKNEGTEIGIKVGDRVSMDHVEIDGAFESGQLRYQATGIHIIESSQPEVEVVEDAKVSEAIMAAAFVEMGDVVDAADAQIDESLYDDDYYDDDYYDDDPEIYERKQPKRLNSARRRERDRDEE